MEGRFILMWVGKAGSDVLEVARQAWAWWKGVVGGKYGVFFFHSGTLVSSRCHHKVSLKAQRG